ncbi:MAG: aspartate kinase [Spirochaetia bacterium]|nr:aspartate kinase [Spirochaetia bacterium]MCF7942475.1 aspartate kinase [Spirochaetia bacterium]
MVVCKFGGSSVADSAQIRKVSRILTDDDSRTVAVVSAPGKRTDDDIKITDMLYTCQKEAAAGIDFSERYSRIRERYLTIAADLQLETEALALEIDEIEQRILHGSGPDYAASRGEYLSAKVIAQFMGWEFLDTEHLIILNSDGTVADRSYALLADALATKEQCILPGFYGTGPNGEVKTFSRGGSDITGAIAARSMGASLYENWTDVSGLRMADPRVIKDPEVVHELTYQEIRELASIGASVFHEEAIAPVRSAEIPICIKNTNDPDDIGTLIVPDRIDREQPVVGISGKTGYYRLYVKKHLLGKETDYILKLSTLLKVHGIIPEFSSIGFDSLSYYFKRDLLCCKQQLLERIKTEMNPEELEMEEQVAMIGVVGKGLYDAKGVLSTLSSSLSDAAIPIRYINYGGSLITCIIGVDDSSYVQALQVMYDAITS